jgi:hypothetical protein
MSQEMELGINSPTAGLSLSPADLAPSRAHVTVPILAATSQCAISELQQRLNAALLNQSHDKEGYLPACGVALKILKYISSKTFSASTEPPPYCSNLNI